MTDFKCLSCSTLFPKLYESYIFSEATSIVNNSVFHNGHVLPVAGVKLGSFIIYTDDTYVNVLSLEDGMMELAEFILWRYYYSMSFCSWLLSPSNKKSKI